MTHVNEFWLLTEDLIALNETVKEVPLTLSLGSIGEFPRAKGRPLQVYCDGGVHREVEAPTSIHDGVAVAAATGVGIGGGGECDRRAPLAKAVADTLVLLAQGETDEIKRVLLETDPWLLGITAVVSTLHMLFDFLAFKNGGYRPSRR